MTALVKLFRTTAFKLSLLYLAIFAIGCSIVIGWTAWNVRRLVEQQIRAANDAEIKGLSEQYAQAGVRRLVFVVDRRTRQPGASLYLVTNFQGMRITGNVAALPPGVLEQTGPVETLYQRDDSQSMDRTALARIFVLPGGFRLLVGRDLEDRDNIYSVMGKALATSLIWLVLIGTLGGLFVARRVLRRVDAMNASAQTIMLGDFSGRLPVSGSHDELDRLAINLNSMIARISGLMEGLKQVSDNIAHDLKTPLTRMRARAEQALREAETSQDHRAALEKVIEESDNLLKVFNALLTIARAESGAARAHMDKLDVSAMIADVVELYEPVAEDAGGRIEIHVAPNLHAHGNRELLGQAMANLIDNAIKHGLRNGPEDATPNSGKSISITALSQGGGIEISVADHGTGIPAVERERIFERFVRLEDARSTPGSGLGLSLVQAIVRLHNGTIHVEDNDPGARVIIRVPAIESASASQGLQPDSKLPAHGVPEMANTNSA